jgi:hypothetical protein
MANQAIALQARAPQQSNILGGALQQGAQMINMMSQQRAAERQAAVAQQQMEIARAAEERAAAKEGRDIERFAVDQDALLYAKYRNMAPAVIASDSPEVYAQWLGMLNKESPERAQMIARAMPPEQFNKDTFTLMMGTMDQNFEARYGKAITKELITPEGGVLGANISGIPGATYAVPVPDISRPRAGAGAQTPLSGAPAPSAFPKTAAPATDAQIDEAAQKIIRGAGIAELGIGAEDFDRASARANQMSAGGGGRMQPISMTTGAQMGGQPDMTAVVQDMMSSGQISQSNLQLMREMAGPDKDAQLAQILKANNIQIVPDDQPGMRSAVFRPGQDVAPQMQQAQFNPNDYEPVRVKPPMQSPMPGSAIVPIERVRQEAQAGRETPREAAAKAAAVARANAEAAAEAKRAEKLPGRKNVSTIIGKMRSAYEQLNKMEAIPSAARGGGANFLDYLAVTRGGREVQKMFGTAPSKYLSQIETLRKQLATAIKNATGMSAQEMNSNVELQLTLDSLSDPTQGIEAALQTMRDLEELYGLPAAPAKKPAAKGGVDMNNPLLRGM